MILNLIGLYLL